MSPHPNVGQLLELGNGEWAIVCISLTFFLIYHLIAVGRMRRIGWRRWICKLPLSMQLAQAFLVVTAFLAYRSASLWYDRATHGGQLTNLNEVSLLIGTAGATVGFMCVLRVVTKPVLGHWPWMITLGAMLAYLAAWALRY
jgi:archaellum biogenesis protein FlaJ (TadC family)